MPNAPLDYAALSSGCRTANEFRRLHIDLENTLAPAELCEIKQFIDRQDVDAPGHKWVDALQQLSPTLFDVPQAYRRRCLSSQITLYQDSASDVAERGLIVAFSGNARRLMLPICVVLQLIDSRRWDIVVLRKDGRVPFLRGLDGVSSTFPGVIRHVQREVSATRYRRTVTLGTSGGGSAAIMAALLMGADRGVSIGGTTPKSRGSRWLRWRLGMCRGIAAAFGRERWYVYGSDYELDRQGARTLQNLYGGELRPVPDADGHNLFRWLLDRGRLAAFLEGLIE